MLARYDKYKNDKISTYGRLQRCRHHAPCCLLGAGEQREEGGQQGEHRVTRHDDRVGAHAARPREPETL